MVNAAKAIQGFRQGPFPGKMTQAQVDGCNTIMAEWTRRQLIDLRWLADMLGTTYHETAFTMQPIQEMGGQKYLMTRKYWPWIGRGYVQLTWQANYVKMQKALQAAGFAVDIVAKPADAMRPDVAAFVMFEGMIGGMFTGKKLSQYFNATTCDWINARRIINGCRKGQKLPDKALEIANYSKAFYADLTHASA